MITSTAPRDLRQVAIRWAIHAWAGYDAGTEDPNDPPAAHDHASGYLA
jgi:hypothetical protein